ncbi:hypothetical protein SAMN02746000_03792 [Paracoccus sp. J56]|nr:hypothetical protein SAMN02746000_03792 [Paracoccus sp. J56]
MTTHERLGSLRLCRILSIAENGRPVLEGPNARILCAGRAQVSDIGRMAVCQDIAEVDESLTVVLGAGCWTMSESPRMTGSSSSATVRLRWPCIPADASE